MMVVNAMLTLLSLCVLSDVAVAETSTDGSQCLAGLIVNQALQLQQYENQLQQKASQLQQQESQLQQLTDQLQQLESKLIAMETAVELNAAGLKVLNATKTKQVSFSVGFKGMPIISVGSGGTVKFNKIVTNVGDGYDLNTGVFTAPQAGVYAFYASLRSSNSHLWIQLGIFKGNVDMVAFTGKGRDDHWDRGSGFVTAHLNKGEQVRVRQVGGGTHLEAGPFTTFSGILVTAD
ncbi:EMILIN-2-like [Babylonia areolata]|uniref:EMILIN-2-like n=1 Tax=Babylonia areolata TaxID=304850 RepID=UPI003FD437E4